MAQALRFIGRPKVFLFALIACMMFVVVRGDLALLPSTPEVAERYRTIGWWLLPHGMDDEIGAVRAL